MGGRMSRPSKTSSHDSNADSDVSDIQQPLTPATSTKSDTDSTNQNVIAVSTLQPISSNNTSYYQSDPKNQIQGLNGLNSGTGLSGSGSGNRQQISFPVLGFIRLGEDNSAPTSITSGSNINFDRQNSVPEIDENLNPSEETSKQNSDELIEENSEVELIFRNSYLETVGKNSVPEFIDQNFIPDHELVPPNYLIDLVDQTIDSTPENRVRVDTGDTDFSSEVASSSVAGENANHTHQSFIPAHFSETDDDSIDSSASSENIAEQATNDTDVHMMTISEESVPVCKPSSLLSTFDPLLIEDIEEYNDRLSDSFSDLSDDDFGTFSDSDTEGLSESAEDMKLRASLKEMMDKIYAPAACAVVSSDTQCRYSSCEQTSTDNTIVAEPVPQNCISAGGIGLSNSPISSEVNNKRKNNGDVQDESKSKRLALDTDVPAGNDVEMEMVDMD